MTNLATILVLGLALVACDRPQSVSGASRLPDAGAHSAQPSAAAAPTDVEGFHDVGLFAKNVVELRDFYSKLGLQLVFEKGDALAVFQVGDREFAIHTSEAQPRGAVGLSFRAANLDAITERLRQLGIPFEGPKPLRPGFTGILVKDPNDNTLAFLRAE